MESIHRKISTLAIIVEGDKVLLGFKKRGFGAGKWNGFGGKVMEGESIETAARRELAEEAGISVARFEKVGILNFQVCNNPVIHEVHLFRGENLIGEPRESEEMRPQWFFKNDIPFSSMWPDDQHWFPLFFQKKKFKGTFIFDAKNTIQSKHLEEIMEV
jgi:8-oxo-dGTP diphosphatase/2-hydroxy-dATP diphosphatase